MNRQISPFLAFALIGSCAGLLIVYVAALFFFPGNEFSLTPVLITMESRISEPQEANFSETGNLVPEGNRWKLIYEEPGKPGLNIITSFDSLSVCLLSGEETPCLNGDIAEPGSRVRIEGVKSDSGVTVRTLTFVE